MKVTLVCLSLVALTAAAYAVPLPQDRSGYDPILEELLEDKSAKRNFNWDDIPKYGIKLFDGLGSLFRRDLYEDAYAMNQREENEEDKRKFKMPWNRLPVTTLDTGFGKWFRPFKRDENVEDSISEELLLDALEQELQNREEEKRDLAERQNPYYPANYMRLGKK